jgi:hypothetical protein
VRDGSGKPVARHERGLAADSPTAALSMISGYRRERWATGTPKKKKKSFHP